MKANLHPINRIIRLVVFDVLLGGPLTGFGLSSQLSVITGSLAIYFLATAIFGFSPIVYFYRNIKLKSAEK